MSMSLSEENPNRMTQDYQRFVINNLDFINNQKSSSDVITITEEIANRYVGDLYGALMELGVPTSSFAIVLLVNELKESHMYDGETMSLYVPSQMTLTKVDRQYAATGV